ncbi:hypothetical protein [Alkalilimnicola ehrlichii]|uniref:EamA domain-containing protein n=1 Tax=Alkalilimnicola ehrlichii TaxID=351052 RepID=A0A3E0X2Y8_9GAMM|nr:hypothetical protein [Alkalilimnicola ehrlichii]RFA38963.1 hypothetical protein CAL65_03440 [Alkalilimnicola ehrlichii]
MRPLLLALFFGIFWGSWGYIANMAAGHLSALRAAGTQFGLSVVVTLIFATAVEQLYLRSETVPRKLVFALLLPIGVLFMLVSSIHYFQGTPNVLLTVVPSVSVAAAICLGRILLGIYRGEGAVEDSGP